MNRQSQKDKFIREIERRIISGELNCGDMLPPERELVAELGMSRTVIHTGLAQLSALGFIKTRPRKGYVVTDYRVEGSMAVLESIMHYNGGRLAPELLQGLLNSRRLIETETASLAAANRTAEDLSNLKKIILNESEKAPGTPRSELDFTFHHTIAVASGNPVYPLILKSFEAIQKKLIENFYRLIPDIETVNTQHRRLVDAVENGDSQHAAQIMTEILVYGEDVLRNEI